uniref:Addiction module component, TIGR02574 family n=1 Tax=Chlorobium chlorochromatii (strain CaD3) TaxID=340177 RepID=Q3ASP8_CHLCH
MNIDHIASEALKLDPKSRAILAETIWESLEDPYLEFSDVTDEEAISLAMKRDEEIETGIVMPLSHKGLMNSLRRHED